VCPVTLRDNIMVPIPRFQRELPCAQLHRLDSRALFDVHLLDAVVRELSPFDWCVRAPSTPYSVCSDGDGDEVRLEVDEFARREQVERVFLAVLVPWAIPERIKWYREVFIVLLEQGGVEDVITYLRREN